MAKVGLKDVLALRAAGYSKKEIEALAAIDEENENKEPDPQPDPQPDPKPNPQPDPEPDPQPEPDYKQLYEDLKKQSEADKATITKLQQDNVHKNSEPDAAEQKKQEADALTALVRSYM